MRKDSLLCFFSPLNHIHSSNVSRYQCLLSFILFSMTALCTTNFILQTYYFMPQTYLIKKFTLSSCCSLSLTLYLNKAEIDFLL